MYTFYKKPFYGPSKAEKLRNWESSLPKYKKFGNIFVEYKTGEFKTQSQLSYQKSCIQYLLKHKDKSSFSSKIWNTQWSK